MKKIKSLLCLTIVLLIVSACSIEKRVHNKGYFVKWHSNPHLFHKNYHPDKEEAETAFEYQESKKNTEEDFPHKNNEILLSERMNNDQQTRLKNERSITVNDSEQTLTEIKSDDPGTTENITQKELRLKNKSNQRADNELIINIVLTVLLLALLILFIYLAIPATGTMVYVWWGLAVVCAIFFVTQVIDLILW